jgi:hypothetical protein
MAISCSESAEPLPLKSTKKALESHKTLLFFHKSQRVLY